MLDANITYLKNVMSYFTEEPVSVLKYKLSRKELYTSAANLLSAYNRMLSEPRSKQRHGSLIYEFIVLNNILFSNTTSLMIGNRTDLSPSYLKTSMPLIRQSVEILEKGLAQLNEPDNSNSPGILLTRKSLMRTSEPGEFPEQLYFIYKVCIDIHKVTKQLKLRDADSLHFKG